MRRITLLFLALCTVHGARSTSAWADDDIKAEDVKVEDVKAKDVKVQETKSDISSGNVSPMIEAVDIPTAEVLDPKTFSTTFRFYSDGGVTSRLILGPFKRLNVGFSLDSQKLIGGNNPHLIRPSAFIKFKFFDGTDYLPAMALGYDNQGYLYQLGPRDFLQREKGIYIVGSHEIFIPDFELHAGVNVPRVDEDGTPFGFFGATWKIVPSFALLAEYDNIQKAPENRVNLGGRFWVTPYFNIDVTARNVGRGSDRGAERMVRLNYVTGFPF